MAYRGESPKVKRVRHIPQSTTPANALEGDVHYADGTALPEGLYVYKDGAWQLTGESAGSLDIAYQENFENVTTTDYNTGDNATFMASPTAGTGGTTGTTDLENTTNPLANAKDLLYTQASGSLNDYIASPEITLYEKHQQKYMGIILNYTYTGNNNDINVVIYDETNDVVIDTFGLEASSTITQRFVSNTLIPDGVTSLRWGVQVAVENIGAVLHVDDVELTINPFGTSDADNIITPTTSMKPASASANNSGGISNATVSFIGFGTTDYDEDSVFTNIGSANSTTYTSTTYATVPYTGKYEVEALLRSDDGALDSGEVVDISIYVNGVKAWERTGKIETTLASPRYSWSISKQLELTAGDDVSIAFFQETGTSIGFNNGAGSSWFQIKQIDTRPVLGAIPKKQVGYLYETQNSGTNAGGSTANTVQIRDLSSGVLKGDFSKFGSLDTVNDRFSLNAGTYDIEITASAYKTNRHQLFLYNFTDSVYILDQVHSIAALADATTDQISNAVLKGRFTIQSSKIFEIRHWTQSTQASSGLGLSTDNDVSNPQEKEIYSITKVEKII